MNVQREVLVYYKIIVTQESKVIKWRTVFENVKECKSWFRKLSVKWVFEKVKANFKELCCESEEVSEFEEKSESERVWEFCWETEEVSEFEQIESERVGEFC